MSRTQVGSHVSYKHPAGSNQHPTDSNDACSQPIMDASLLVVSSFIIRSFIWNNCSRKQNIFLLCWNNCSRRLHHFFYYPYYIGTIILEGRIIYYYVGTIFPASKNCSASKKYSTKNIMQMESCFENFIVRNR